MLRQQKGTLSSAFSYYIFIVHNNSPIPREIRKPLRVLFSLFIRNEMRAISNEQYIIKLYYHIIYYNRQLISSVAFGLLPVYAFHALRPHIIRIRNKHASGFLFIYFFYLFKFFTYFLDINDERTRVSVRAPNRQSPHNWLSSRARTCVLHTIITLYNVH